MNLNNKVNLHGILGAGIFLAAFFLGFLCHAVAAETDGVPIDKAALQDCLSRALEAATDETTVEELRKQCRADAMPEAYEENMDSPLGEAFTDNQDEDIVLPFFKSLTENEREGDLLEGRIYTDDQNILRPFTLMSHQPNFILLASYNNSPNEDPARDAYNDDDIQLDKTEAQFQVSIKVPLAIDVFDRKIDFYGAYTVRSYWQVYNDTLSSVFRETNYSPEGWVQIHSDWSLFGIRNVANMFGFVHQSNGRDDPLSRSWNRLFANFVFEKGNLIFAIKTWYRLPEDDKDDNNTDITDYLGHGHMQFAYKWNRHVFALMSRNNLESGFKKGAVEATWSFPLGNYKYLKGYIQGFTGYGQSMIDYDSNETTIGIGFSVTDFLF